MADTDCVDPVLIEIVDGERVLATPGLSSRVGEPDGSESEGSLLESFNFDLFKKSEIKRIMKEDLRPDPHATKTFHAAFPWMLHHPMNATCSHACFSYPLPDF